MADPFNYTIASPAEAFQKAYAFGDAITQRQQQQAQQAAAQQRTQQVNDALVSIANDRSPENIAQKLLMFPELKEQITQSESVLGEAERKSANSLRAEVISLARSGNVDAARARLETQAQAYANTPGKEQQAQAAQSLLQAFDRNPEAVILPMTIQLAQSDEKLYGTLFGAGEMTAFQKNLAAAGIDPNSDRGRQLAEQFAVNQADPLVEVETPKGTKFVGPRSEYFRRYGANAPAPNTIPAPKSQEEYNKIIRRTGTAPDGRRVVQYQDGTVEYVSD
jgi:hypothetical protein